MAPSDCWMTIGAWWLTSIMYLIILGILMILLVKRAKFLYCLRNVPSPFALPVIGNAFQLNCSLEEFFRKLIIWSKKFGDIYILWLGTRPFIFVYRAEDVQPLLSSSVHIDKSLEYQYLKPWLGTGLITSTGDKWHFRRKLLTPSFHSGIVDNYLKSTIHEASIMVSCLQKEIGKADFDIVPYAKRAALDIICVTSMGYHLNAQTDVNNEYVVAVERMSSIIQTRFTNIWMSLDTIFKRTSLGKVQDESLGVIHRFVDTVIGERKAERNESKLHTSPITKQNSKRVVLPLLDMLLDLSFPENGNPVLSDTDIRDEVNTFLFAGHDTVATSVSWILYTLGRHPEYQLKILEEYNELIGSNEITLESLNKLMWLDACVKETWRLYPVVPLLARQIYQPITLMNTEVPVGSTVLVNTFLLHRDPRYFPQPEVYRPERFLPNSPKLPAFSYIPFSAGSRNCIGMKFAIMETKITVITILKSFVVHSLQPPDKLRLESSIVLVNAHGIRLNITPRL